MMPVAMSPTFIWEVAEIRWEKREANQMTHPKTQDAPSMVSEWGILKMMFNVSEGSVFSEDSDRLVISI